MRRVLPTLLGLLLLLLLLPTAAGASGRDVLLDCGDDEQLAKRYSQREYRDALNDMDADLRQYTSCQAVIRAAQLSAASAGGGRSTGPAAGGGPSGGSGGGGTGGSSGGTGASTAAPSARDTVAAATPAQKREIAQVVAAGSAPVAIAGAGVIDPASAGEVPSLEAIGDLPRPVSILLALLVAGVLALGIGNLRGRALRRRAT